MYEVYHRILLIAANQYHLLTLIFTYCMSYLCVRIVGMLSPEELGLFREQIRSLDRKIQLGLTKVSWLLKGAANVFVNDCLLHIGKV